MQGLTQAVSDLAEALRWGRSSVALFRQVGDRKYAANTLFLMAQRAIYDGVTDDEVHERLVESRASPRPSTVTRTGSTPPSALPSSRGCAATTPRAPP